MKKKTYLLGTFLIGLSVLLHSLHFYIFRDIHHILVYLLGDIAFIPLEVFFVSLVLDKMIEKREHKQVVKKINMIVGLFYQELGNKLLSEIVKADVNLGYNDANIDFEWDDARYKKLEQDIINHNHEINISHVNLDKINHMISEHQQLITNIITNPVIHEHERFTDVLMSIFHLYEELKQRSLSNLKDHDYQHLKVDIERVYKNLTHSWIEYLKYLQVEYPYLFSSAITNNPFNSQGNMAV